MYCWASHPYWGEAGCAATYTPTQIGTDTTWTSIATGSYQSCGVNASGTFCWGANYWAQLGNGTTSNDASTCTPTPVAGNHAFVSVAAGADHACGLLADGHAYCWGHNVAGQVGNGTVTDVATPVSIGNQSWSQIAGGYLFTCGVGVDGSLWCWGDNSRGELGLGTFESQLVPMRVGTDTDWQKVALGAYFACALKTDHSLWCWGANDFAQLGDGTGWREQLVRVP
jgi:alpha-tubulin suppressor-like RCC1 family protein